jgi:uncharacterized protein (DUF427 family)
MHRPKLLPNAAHPITVTPTEGRVRVLVGDTVVADTTRALTLQEASYPPVQYVPLEDCDPALLTPTATSTYCPFKGEAAYYSVVTPEATVEDAGWSYPEAYDAVGEVRGHVAWYPTKVTVEVG